MRFLNIFEHREPPLEKLGVLGSLTLELLYCSAGFKTIVPTTRIAIGGMISKWACFGNV